MKRALISDIHGNFAALSAVLDFIKTIEVDEIFCLGDIIGYGPDPLQCLDTVMNCCNMTILGNHDQAAIFDPEGFNPVAMRAIFWTREQLEKDTGERADLRWDFLGELPRQHDEGQFLYVHGSPRDPTNEYVFPEHVYEKTRMESLMKRFDKFCFQGHTHIPGVFLSTGTFLQPNERDNFFELADELSIEMTTQRPSDCARGCEHSVESVGRVGVGQLELLHIRDDVDEARSA